MRPTCSSVAVTPPIPLTRPARQTIAVGETYDFALDLPRGRQTVWVEVRSTSGKWLAQGQVIAK